MLKNIHVFVCCATVMLMARIGIAGGSNPYLSIPSRNVFRLVPSIPSPPPPVELVTLLPSPPVVVTGVTDVCGRRQVFLEVGGAGKVVHKPVLEEGAAIEGIRVLGIDVRAACVRLTWNGIEKILPLGTAGRGPENAPKPMTRQ